MTEDLFAIGYAAENRDPPWKWAEEKVRLRDSPYGDRFVISETPWLKEPLESLADNSVQEECVCASVQTGKSLMMQVGICWALDQQPDNTMFVAHTTEMVKIAAREKIMPMIESVASLAEQLPQGTNRHHKTTREILFPNATLLLGPANESFLRSHSVRHVFGDEPSKWPPGKMDQARARTTRFWNRKIFFGSTPLLAGDDFIQAALAGNQRKYHMACPICAGLVYLTSDNLEKIFQWETSDRTKPGGEWDYTLVRETVRFVCPHCKETTRQTAEIYRKMLADAQYVTCNPKAPSYRKSHFFNVFILPPSVYSWEDLVEAWLRAKAEELKGNYAPLREFVTLRLAETWDERRFLTVTIPNFESYAVDKKWEKERSRFLTVDCQEHLAEFWAIVRAWSADGSSRLLAFERLYTEAEIENLRKQWEVPPHLTCLDCAYERHRVFEMCVRNGWTALEGSDRNEFLHTENGKKLNRPFSPVTSGDPRSGKTYAGKRVCPLFRWSNPTIKDLLGNLKSGKGASWSVCELPELGDEYALQTDSERKREDQDRFGRTILKWKKFRRNHAWDAECMQVVLATMAKYFG